ncbi:MAG: hypothetical protein KJ058_00455 [Thermoanaerobaculia bacterium]|nr:hypothetical protein [Thermoanaerobaculia bacterium]
MSDSYKVYDSAGKLLSGRSPVDRETAVRVLREAGESAGPGQAPSLVRVDREKPGPGENE